MGNVVSLHPAGVDYWDEVDELIDWLREHITDLPRDDLTPGYRLLATTRADLQLAARLLEEARDVIEGAIEAEDVRYNEYAEHWESRHPEED